MTTKELIKELKKELGLKSVSSIKDVFQGKGRGYAIEFITDGRFGKVYHKTGHSLNSIDDIETFVTSERVKKILKENPALLK